MSKKSERRYMKEDGWSFGDAVCLVCRHQWQASIEPGLGTSSLECPECGSSRVHFTECQHENCGEDEDAMFDAE